MSEFMARLPPVVPFNTLGIRRDDIGRIGDMQYETQSHEPRPEFPGERIDRVAVPLARFLHMEALGGLALLAAACVAVVLANSPYRHAFASLWSLRVGLRLEGTIWDRTVRHWINDGLMTLFFFVVGLELKRELVGGELSQLRKAILPVFAALGGMVVPAGLYLALSRDPYAARGWGVVMTTDTAFVIGCLALLGRRIPGSLRAFLLAVAIIDDLGAVLVVALGYGHGFESVPFSLAVALFGVTALMRWLGVRPLIVYWLLGLGTWAALHESGIHPVIVGIAFALLTPTSPWVDEARLTRFLRWANQAPEPVDGHRRETVRILARAARESMSPLERLETRLHPWSSFFVLPAFALANADVRFVKVGVFGHVALLTIVGLAIGKPLGIFIFARLSTALRIAEGPSKTSWPMLLAASILSGMGFSMSLYISQLAFSGAALHSAKLGILLASLLAGATGTVVLYLVSKRPAAAQYPAP